MSDDPENTAAVRAHKATLISSEMTRQSKVAAALATYVAGGTAAVFVAAVKSEDVAHHRRILSSARSNSVTIPTPSIEALYELGQGGA
jgi:hypothetical protein